MRTRASIIIAMVIFGSIGIFVKNIDLSSLEIALLRAVIAGVFLIAVGVITNIDISFRDIKANGLLLILSGACMGLNWVALFQGYKYTTVSNATLGYYFAPIFVMVLSPIFLKEKTTPAKIICTFVAMFGLFLIINADGIRGDNTYNHVLGMIYAVSGAALYATVILINKHIKNLPSFETTLLQLIMAAIVLLPIVLLQFGMDMLNMEIKSRVNILLLGVVHTGIAYLLYFKSFKKLKAQSIAILSYIDPVSAVIMATIFLKEDITAAKIIGGILILGSAYFAESMENRVLTAGGMDGDKALTDKKSK